MAIISHQNSYCLMNKEIDFTCIYITWKNMFTLCKSWNKRTLHEHNTHLKLFTCMKVNNHLLIPFILHFCLEVGSHIKNIQSTTMFPTLTPAKEQLLCPLVAICAVVKFMMCVHSCFNKPKIVYIILCNVIQARKNIIMV